MALLQLVQTTKAAGIPKRRTCALLQITCRRIERWTMRYQATGSLTDHPPGPEQASHALLPSEKHAVVAYASRATTADYSLHVLAIKGAEAGLFFLSASSVRLILHETGLGTDRRLAQRQRGAGRKPQRPPELIGPNQCWCWDISYIPTELPRVFWYLFVLLDEWSRKVVAWRLCARPRQEEAQALIDTAFLAEDLFAVPVGQRPVIVNDRGPQMKAKPLQQMCVDLGLPQAFARPRTPNDNPFIEAFFSTVKRALTYPGQFPADDIREPQQYFANYFQWYNTEHYHSRIGYVHPADKHAGRAEDIIKERKRQLAAQRNQRAQYWKTQHVPETTVAN